MQYSWATYISFLVRKETSGDLRHSLQRVKKVLDKTCTTHRLSHSQLFPQSKLLWVAVAADRFQLLLGHPCDPYGLCYICFKLHLYSEALLNCWPPRHKTENKFSNPTEEPDFSCLYSSLHGMQIDRKTEFLVCMPSFCFTTIGWYSDCICD